MTDKATLLALADRVEALDGPCRETDLAIATLTRAPQPADKWFGKRQAKQERAYTKSIDAALKLLPADSFFLLGHDIDGPNINEFRASVGIANGDLVTFSHRNGATPALALIAAALRAMAGGVDHG